jgi:hypothetical protein
MKNSQYLKRHPIYEATYEQMTGYQLSYLGGMSFKRSVRKKRPSEDSNLYQDLILNTVAQPISRYVVDTVNDVLFEPGVKRIIRFATPEGRPIADDNNNMSWAELFQLDADLTNRTLTGFMENVGDLTSIFGHCWIFVDMPRQNEGNLGRPYVVAMSPLNVWDWEWEYYGGKQILKYVKVLEHEEEDCYYFKCYHLGDETRPSYWQTIEVEKAQPEKEAEIEEEGEFPPGMGIPGFIAYGRRDPRTIDVGVSDIDSASEAMREHYKLECEAYSSIQFAKTIIRADKGVAVPAHAGAIVRATQGQVETISVDTGDVDKIIGKQRDILEQIEALTGLGGIRNSKNQVQSGISIIEERKQLHRIAKSKARHMEVAEEMLWTYASRFMGMRWAGEVIYGTDYESHDTNYRIAVMKQAKELIPDNELINGMILKEVVELLAPAEQRHDYQQALFPTLPIIMQQLEEECETEVYTRDIGSQIPVEEEEEGEEENGEYEEEDNEEVMMPTGDGITYTGASYYTQDAIAAQITGQNIGR